MAYYDAPRQLRQNKTNTKKLRFVVGGKKFVLFCLSLNILSLFCFLTSAEGAGSAALNSEMTTLVKFASGRGNVN